MSCDEDLQSWGWTDLSGCSTVPSDWETEQQSKSSLQAAIMSRRSLRLHDGLLDRNLPRSSTSFIVAGTSWRSTRSLKLSSSCSGSLLPNTPRKPSAQPLNSSVLSGASDATLLSSLLEDSVQDRTLVSSLWGLDHDIDLKESTVMAEQSAIMAEQSAIMADRTLIGSCCPPAHTLGRRVYSKNCDLDSNRKEPTCCPSFSAMGQGPSEPRDLEMSIYCRDRIHKPQSAPSSHGGVMESTTNQKEPYPNGPRCGDCRETQRPEPAAPPSGSLMASWLLGLMRSAAVFTASCLCQLALSAAPAVWPLTRTMCSASWRAGRCAGQRAGGVARWLCRRGRVMTTRDLLTRVPVRLLLLLLPLLLLLTALQAVLPETSIPDWRTAASNIPGLSSVYSYVSASSQPAEGAVEEQELICNGPPPGEEEPAAESLRLLRLEQSLAALWERMEAGGRRAELKHEDLPQPGAELWQHGGGDESRLDQDRRHRFAQGSGLNHRNPDCVLGEQEVQWRREAAADPPSPPALPAAVRVRVDRHSHDALLAEVAQLEASVEDLRRVVEGLSASGLDAIQQTVSEQVSSQVLEEVRTLVYGNQRTVGGRPAGEGLPESLLQWLSQRYVSGADLQVALVSLELSILQNISLQLEQHCSQELVREAVLHPARAAGAGETQEDVHEIVKNALRLFSQDRTGLADYALESGGGSILTTRCSDTYETRAALLSLFGFPLWHFSQSPRAVIQPDVHPGNCWAFRGSKGFLVIRLSMRIVPTAFSLDHVPKALAPSGMVLSAPRHFSVYGLADDDEERGKLLGSYSYEEDGESVQTFAVTEDCGQAFQIIEVQVLSNWGHPEYTCMYRFRVHGTPADA